MSCHETRELIHGYLDGELDLVKSLEIESHLEDCDACAKTYKGVRGLRSALAHSAVRFDPPTNFEGQVRSALRREDKPHRRSTIFRWQWLVAATSVITVFAVIWAVSAIRGRQSQSDVIGQEIVSSHVRSLMADHLTDVPSSDQHTVKPWFDGRLDFSPPVKDLSQQGFSLNGGRLDYIGHRPVAALVYQRRQHPINLFVWPATEPTPLSEKASVSHGYNLIRWSSGGMAYWVVSDLNLAELQQFAQSIEK